MNKLILEHRDPKDKDIEMKPNQAKNFTHVSGGMSDQVFIGILDLHLSERKLF